MWPLPPSFGLDRIIRMFGSQSSASLHVFILSATFSHGSFSEAITGGGVVQPELLFKWVFLHRTAFENLLDMAWLRTCNKFSCFSPYSWFVFSALWVFSTTSVRATSHTVVFSTAWKQGTTRSAGGAGDDDNRWPTFCSRNLWLDTTIPSSGIYLCADLSVCFFPPIWLMMWSTPCLILTKGGTGWWRHCECPRLHKNWIDLQGHWYTWNCVHQQHATGRDTP